MASRWLIGLSPLIATFYSTISMAYFPWGYNTWLGPPVTNISQAPASAVVGSVIADSANDSLYMWTGSTWMLIASGGGSSPTGPAGGDLGGTYPNPTVTSLADVPGYYAVPSPSPSNYAVVSNGSTYVLDPYLPAMYPNPSPSPSGYVVEANGSAYVLVNPSGFNPYPVPSPSPSGYYIESNGSAYVLASPAPAGVSSVTATAPISSTGGSTPVISVSPSPTFAGPVTVSGNLAVTGTLTGPTSVGINGASAGTDGDIFSQSGNNDANYGSFSNNNSTLIVGTECNGGGCELANSGHNAGIIFTPGNQELDLGSGDTMWMQILHTGDVVLANTDASSGVGTGSFQTGGGVYVAKTSYFGNALVVTNGLTAATINGSVFYPNPSPSPSAAPVVANGASFVMGQPYMLLPTPSPSAVPLMANGSAWVQGQAYQVLPSPSPSGYVVTATGSGYTLSSASATLPHNALGTYGALITNNGTTCTVTSQAGSQNWVASGVRNGTGDCTMTLQSGIFANAPYCWCASDGANGSSSICVIRNDLTPVTATTVRYTQRTASGLGDDTDYLYCIGT